MSSNDNTNECESGRLYAIGLELQQCAKSWEGDARLIGNITASDLLAMSKDYTRLRLQEGIQGSSTNPSG
jgi:hypothetical protein